MQVSPSGMAAASQAVPGEFDSRHLLHKRTGVHFGTMHLELFEGAPVFIREIKDFLKYFN